MKSRALEAAGAIAAAVLAAHLATSSARDPAPGFVWLRDVAGRAGLNARNHFGGEDSKRYILETTGNGVAIIDYNNDGWPDIFLVNGKHLESAPAGQEPTNHLYRNNKDGTFTDVTRSAGLVRSGWGQGACVGDYDGDGFDDLLVTYYGSNVLYRNRGDGTFTDATAAAGLPISGKRWGTGCTFFDADGDGKLDLLVANYVQFDLERAPAAGESTVCRWKGIPVMCGPRGLPKGANALYHNNGDGTFTDVSVSSGIAQASGYYCFTPVVLDFDNNGRPDVYVSCDSTPNILYENLGGGVFRDVGIAAGAALNEDGKEQAGMGVGVADFDHDGWLDLFVTNFSDDTSTLYRNVHGTFADVTREFGLGLNTQYLGWGVGFVDLDHDGWKDIFSANGHVYPEVDRYSVGSSYRQTKLVYRNDSGKRFVDLSSAAGPGATEPHSARGVAFADLDNDGKLEMVINNMNELPSLLVNDAPVGNSVILALHASGFNRRAVGARVVVTVGNLVQMDEVRSGGSYMSQNDFRLHFGVGQATSIDKIQVRWPNGKTQIITNAPANARLDIVEGRAFTHSEKFSPRAVAWQPPSQ